MPDADSSSPGGSVPPGSVSSSLLDRVKAQSPEAWQRLVALYGPLIFRWCRQSGLQAEGAADVVQEVFAAVARRAAGFRRERPGDSFLAWLGTITRNKVRDHFRRRRRQAQAQGGTDAQERFSQIPDRLPDPGAADRQSKDGSYLARRCLELTRAEFEDRTWQAFWRLAVEGHAAADVTQDLGTTVQAVYKAKSRVMRRLRGELSDVLP